ncbi:MULTISPECIES: SGNH/GDSL hydrolase family protein [unclassified Achromobacter]|uniref:SGNH/GDSL hydrolase family protein n=1 Tax=unclassified Achromobacter TaxID=2626865 RepID=UPI000B514DD5|nr:MULTISPECIES: SGNH/GDSL hydrolase family protein [unclassified Achromobacter]OWT81151.1 lipase [Achromobacter sp. HZ34]OWT81541.1 lipase [Achromobacter sp. HZ28]
MSQSMKSRSSASAVLALVLATGSTMDIAPAVAASPAWVATWQASPQPVWGTDFLFPTNVPPVLHDQTVRQVARISLGGQRLRIVLSNAYGQQPLTVGKATVAQPGQGGDVVAGSMRTVTFGGRDVAHILPGASLVSDPVVMPLPALARVTVSLYLPNTTPLSTFHWDGRETGWIVSGDQSSALALTKADGAAIQDTTARPLLTGIQVETGQPAHAVAVIGDSITDGATASLDKNSRWPDFLAARLAPHGVAVVNAGISGARLLSDGMGVNALARLDRDVLGQPGVRSVIVMVGINDISWPGTAFARDARRPTLEELTAGYRQLVEQAHSRGVRVLGATLTPFEGALPGTPLDNYYQPDKEILRQQVNDWIRHGGVFDAVIDFDEVLRDPSHARRIAERYDSGDHLHPGDEGNRAMAEAVDLESVLPELGTFNSSRCR